VAEILIESQANLSETKESKVGQGLGMKRAVVVSYSPWSHSALFCSFLAVCSARWSGLALRIRTKS